MRKILAGMAVVVIGLFVVIATRPSTFRVERSAMVNAPPWAVFERINSFAAWDDWSPWAKLDPNMKKTVTGPGEGVGARYAWESADDNVGSGEMIITESVSDKKIVMDLHMKPFEGKNVATFSMDWAGPTGCGTSSSLMRPRDTTVTWSMEGENGFLGKAMSLVKDVDKIVGPDLEKGLTSLKALAEADASSEGLARKAEEKAAALTAAAADGSDPEALHRAAIAAAKAKAAYLARKKGYH